MINSKDFLSIIKSLGESIEKRDNEILVQQYEINMLKETIERLEKKENNK